MKTHTLSFLSCVALETLAQLIDVLRNSDLLQCLDMLKESDKDTLNFSPMLQVESASTTVWKMPICGAPIAGAGESFDRSDLACFNDVWKFFCWLMVDLPGSDSEGTRIVVNNSPDNNRL